MNGVNKHQNKNNQGQVLLIIILISAVLLTVGLSVSQLGNQDTKIAKIEADSKKAFSAAEAGLDAALKSSGTVNIANLLPAGSGVSGYATADATLKPTFVSPLVKKDDQYTFYLGDYANNFSSYYTQALNVYYQSNKTNIPAIELTLIKNNGTVIRFAADSEGRITGATTPGNANYTLSGYSQTPFSYQVNINQASIGGTTKFLIVRALYHDTKIGLEATGLIGNPLLPLQGKTVTSTAITSTNVAKRIQLFQSYPQFPADFFVTSF
jgi:Tfp pilus assembly protein PilX